MRRNVRAWLPVLIALCVALSTTVALALPSTAPDNTGMVDFPGAGSGGNTVAVRTIVQAGDNVWVGGILNQIDDANGTMVRSAGGVAAFNATSGSLASGVHIPVVTKAGGAAVVYDMSVGPDGNLYFAGTFDAVDGQTRHNVAAVDAQTGQLTSFAPNVGSTATAILATSSSIYVGTGKLLSFQRNGAVSPGYHAPTVIIDAALRAHETAPNFRDIAILGNTLVAACQCDSLTDANGTRTVKAVVEVNASTGNWVNWRPANLPDSNGPFGISLLVHADPGSGAPTVYLAAGGSDFTAAYDFNSGAQRFKTDTSGSSQAITWYQGMLLVGGHFDWTQAPGVASCGDNDHPDTDCYHSPKLVAMSPTNGAVQLVGGKPWNPGICCKYNGVWALLTGNDGSTLHVGGEFTRVGGTWSGSGTNWNLNGASTQKFYARLGGPPSNTQTLTVSKASTAGGAGTVTSTPAGIDCAAACPADSADFATGSSVTMTASPSVGSTFTGWSSADAGFSCPGTGTCTVSMNIARTVTASFAGVSYTLTLTKTGGGTGTVTSNPVGITCGATCSGDFTQGTVVTLTAAPGTNAVFAGWSGSGCSGTGTCVVTMNAVHAVSADFEPDTNRVLTVQRSGASGTVTSNPAGIDCGVTCTASFAVNTSVTLTAVPGTGNIFSGWSSSDSGFGCRGTGTCTVSMNIARTVTATFAGNTDSLTVAKSGAGGGTVTSSPAGISCGATCSAAFAQNTVVTLTAVPNGTSAFTGWSGEGCSGTGSCVVTMSAARSVTADFELARRVALTMAGTGSGVVTSDPAGMNCTASCEQPFAQGSTATLTATADVNSIFTGWSGTGGCTGVGTCVLVMSQRREVTATFQPAQTLTVTPAGTGGGSVTSSPAGVDCGITCSTKFATGTVVTLSASPDVNSAFTGWSGEGCSGTGACVVTMNQARNVTATFTLVQHELDVAVVGQGSVTDTPGPIDCVGPQPDTGTCSGSYDHGTDVELVANPATNWSFSGWSGDCTGTVECVVSMTAAHAVTATFELVSHTVDVSPAGSGTGTVTSTPAGIACPSDCSEGYHVGDSVQLTAAADPGSVFTGWGGDCSGTSLCNLTIDGEKNVTATFDLLHTLTVTTNGSGSGQVASGVGGIACPATSCVSADRPHGTHVILTATPDPGSALSGWSGGGCSTPDPTCDVTMGGDVTVTATFAPAANVAITTSGLGAGIVTSAPAGLSCPGTCTAPFAQGGSVTLHAASSASSVFAGWIGGGCSGTADCVVALSSATTVDARFDLAQRLLTVGTAGSGGGTVSSSPGSIVCPGTCGQTFDHGTVVQLTAAPDSGSTFAGWAGDTACTAGDNPCAVTMDQARNVTATFALVTHTLSVTRNGSGAGTVTADSGAIDCGATCSDQYGAGLVVQLTAAPDAGSVFAGWTGGGCSGTAACVVTMSGDTSVTATFSGSSFITLTDADPAIAYNGWTSVSDAGASGGAYRRSNVKGDKIIFKTAASTSVQWLTRTGPDGGNAKVLIDGVNEGTVNGYSAAPASVSRPFTGLPNQVHTVVITVLHTKQAASTDYFIWLDAFVVGSTTTQESDPKVQYDTWKSTVQAKATDGTYRLSKDPKATATVTFTGTAIDWITTMGKAYGQATVTIDGVVVRTVDLYQPTATWRFPVSFTGLSAGPHTMTIQLLGTKNASATAANVVVDGFIVHP